MALTFAGPPSFSTFEQVRQYLQQHDYHLYGVELAGADGATTTFTSPMKIRTDVTGHPQALLYQGTGLVLYDADDPPAAGRWTLRRDHRTVVMGTAPTAGVPFLFLEMWAVL